MSEYRVFFKGVGACSVFAEFCSAEGDLLVFLGGENGVETVMTIHAILVESVDILYAEEVIMADHVWERGKFVFGEED